MVSVDDVGEWVIEARRRGAIPVLWDRLEVGGRVSKVKDWRLLVLKFLEGVAAEDMSEIQVLVLWAPVDGVLEQNH